MRTQQASNVISGDFAQQHESFTLIQVRAAAAQDQFTPYSPNAQERVRYRCFERKDRNYLNSIWMAYNITLHETRI